MNLFKVVITNIKNYGIYQTLILVIYEIIYAINNEYNKHVFYDESVSDKYFFAKKK